MLVLCFQGCVRAGFEAGDLLRNLQEGKRTDRVLHFYPSTLRAMNISKNPDYYALIQDLRRLVFYRLKDDFTTEELNTLERQLRGAKEFEEYIRINNRDLDFLALGKENPDELIALVDQKGTHYILHFLGMINIFQAQRFFEDLQEGDNNDQFVDILSLIGENKRNANKDTTESINPIDSLTHNQDTIK